MKLWLACRGGTKADIAGLYSDHALVPLTSYDVARTRALGERLWAVPLNRVVYSGLVRTTRTTDLPLDDRHIPRENHIALNEMPFGDWEMRHYCDLQREDAQSYVAWCVDWQYVAPASGESFQSSVRHVSEFTTMPADCRHLDHLLIVGHQGILSPLTALLLQMPAAVMWHSSATHDA